MNCTYIYENTCYNENINYGNYIIGGILLVGFFAIPIYCATRYCQIKRQIQNQNTNQNINTDTYTNNRIILIPGYVHANANIDRDLPPEYKEVNNPERIV